MVINTFKVMKMKRLSHILMLAGICLAAASCWKEDIPEAGAGRHQVENLKAVPGDEEVLLTWNAAEGWNPTDYIITYTGPDGKQSINTGDKTEWTVSNLVNGTDYVFGQVPGFPRLQPSHFLRRYILPSANTMRPGLSLKKH